MNNTPNAIEIRLSDPIASAAKPAVSIKPAASVTMIAPTSFTERSAINRIAQTITTDSTVERSAPSRNVANCSSSSATEPVRRRRTPLSELKPSSDARRRISVRAVAPDSRPEKSSTGRVITKRRRSRALGLRPVIISVQDRLARLPSMMRCTTLPIIVRVGSSCATFSVSVPAPDTKIASASNSPRRLGSCARLPIKGCAAISCCATLSSSSGDRYRSPLRSKNGPPSGWRTCVNSCGSARILSASSAAACSARSGVRASMTATSRLLFCGNASSRARSFCRQATLLGSMRSMSVSTARWPAA